MNQRAACILNMFFSACVEMSVGEALDFRIFLRHL